MTEARPADGERGSEDHRLVLFSRQLGQPARDVEVGGREHARLVELAQRAGGAQDEARVAHPVSSTSLRAATSSPGGRQENTPPGAPRTNR